MRRKILIGAASFLGLILILAIAVFWYIRSGRLDRYIQARIVEALADFGIRAEIGNTRLSLTGYTVTLDNIKLYAGDAQNHFGVIDNITVKFSVASYLRQRINITEVTVTHPQVWVAFDEQGRFNLADLHAPPRKEAEESAITFLSAYVRLLNGELYYDDRLRQATAEIKGFNADFTPLNAEALDEQINHRLTLAFEKASATYEGRPIQNISSRIEAHVTKENATVNKLELKSDLGELAATARIESFMPFKYETKDLSVEASLGEIARVFTPDTTASGKVKFAGAVTGTNDDYRAVGSIQSDEVSAEGFRVAGIRVQTDVTGKGDKYNAKADIVSSGVTGRDLVVNSIRLTDATLSGEGSNYSVEDALSVGSVKSGKINISDVRGSLSAEAGRVGLARFSASMLGGSVTGSASLATDGGSSRVEAAFRSIDLNQATELAAARDVEVRGTASGNVNLEFPGTNYQAATGRINSTFDASIRTPEASESAPARGEVSLIATGRGFNIQRAYVRSAASDLTATGTVGWNGVASLNVNFKSDDMAEVQRVIEAFGFLPADLKRDYPINVSGPGSFVGRLEGKLGSQTVTGHLSLSSVVAGRDDTVGRPGEELGALEADITYSPKLVRVEGGSLVRADNSRIDFNVTAPLVGRDNIAVQATIQNFNTAALASIRIPGFSNILTQGTVSGTIDLRGLPGPRTIEGTAQLALSGGELALPSLNPDEEDKRLALESFAGNITLANSVVRVDDLSIKIGDAEIKGQGNFNLDTYAYSINAAGSDIPLSLVADIAATSEDSKVNLSGTADINIVGQGELSSTDDWAGLGINATIQGRNVVFEGRELGDPKIVARTENGQLIIEATGNVLDEERTLAATINLRDRTWPVNAAIEFTDTDIGPYLGLVAPELSGVTGRATGRITLSGPLQKKGEGFSAEGIAAEAVITRLELGGKITEQQQYTITNQGDIVVRATTAGITINPVTFVGEGTSLTIERTISRTAAASNLRGSGEINLRLLSSFTSTVFTTGIARVETTIEGSLDAPQLRGLVSLRDVGVRVVDVPLSIARGNGQIRFTVDQALIENFTAATPGGGTISITGGAALAGLAPERWRLDVTADQVGIEYPRDTQTVFDAELALQGNRRLQVLSGEVIVRRAAYTRDITIEELLTGGGPFGSDFLEAGPGGAGAGAGGMPTTLDIHVVADDTLVIKNNLADAVASAFMNIRGPAEDPLISGRVQLTRGTLEFRRGRFELTRGLITLPGRRRAEPIIDIQSEADISGYHIEVSFTGEISRLETLVRSDPPLPEPDIVSLVLTGNVSSDASTQASVTQTGLGLAQSILSASLSEQLEQQTQKLFGISRFSIDPLLVGRGSDPTARITIGQRITRDLTVTYSQNLTSGPSGIDRVILVEYRISNRFSVVGLRNERGELGFDVRLRKRF